MSIREELVKETIELLRQSYEKYRVLSDEEREEVDKFLESLEKEDK